MFSSRERERRSAGVSKLSKICKTVTPILAHFWFFWFSIVTTSDSSIFWQLITKYQMSLGKMWSTEQGKQCANYALVFLGLRIYNLPFFSRFSPCWLSRSGCMLKSRKLQVRPPHTFFHTIYTYIITSAKLRFFTEEKNRSSMHRSLSGCAGVSLWPLLARNN